MYVAQVILLLLYAAQCAILVSAAAASEMSATAAVLCHWLCTVCTYLLFSERQVAYNLLQALQTTSKPTSAFNVRKHAHPRHPTAGVQTSYSMWKQAQDASLQDGNLYISGMAVEWVNTLPPPLPQHFRTGLTIPELVVVA